ncbi:hypothetical protein H6G14_29865 [Nostoc parmelioides FACHB-3921]|uniref:Uncharacterized protein n=1 Tax=Nostoc parmelioides FACHB-3921 TaxID=2692909 RepID=A0ABR8BPF7_9NOSO|nr:hypothetical protein [Nostoc parmelioides]MBD2255420.1 hypothetical protein [Nostoc parmelioides FACHB-3921]
MKATIAWWDLSQSHQTIDTLRDYLQNEGVLPWSGTEGMILKFWFSDRKTNRWGAVMLWASDADMSVPLPPNRATELIGYPPTERMSTELDAWVGGTELSALSGHNRTFVPERML